MNSKGYNFNLKTFNLLLLQAACYFSAHRCAVKNYPKDLPTISVVLIYLDEAFSIIKRAIRSIVDKTPARLLQEIILVDDHSSNGESACFQNNFHIIFRLWWISYVHRDGTQISDKSETKRERKALTAALVYNANDGRNYILLLQAIKDISVKYEM